MPASVCCATPTTLTCDSAAVHTRFNEYYTPEREAKILGLKERSIQPWNTPRRYRSFVERGWTIDSIQVKTLQERDSLDVAVHTYDFKKIAHNESRRKYQDVYHRNILHFPLIPDAHMTEEIKPDQDFVYLYSRDIEVTPKMQRRLRVLMESRVTARGSMTSLMPRSSSAGVTSPRLPSSTSRVWSAWPHVTIRLPSRSSASILTTMPP